MVFRGLACLSKVIKEINSIVKIYEPGKIYLDGHTNLFNTQALFYAVLPHRVSH